MNKHISTIVSVMLLIGGVAAGQVDTNSELFKALKIEDSLLFERGFNQCDVPYLKSKIKEDMKFYHDQSGLQTTEDFFRNTELYICSGQGPKPIRKLVAGSLVVFPLYNNGTLYGAIQSGEHNFYLREEGKEDRWTSVARFTSIWVLENEVWKFADCLSYDHGPPSEK